MTTANRAIQVSSKAIFNSVAHIVCICDFFPIFFFLLPLGSLSLLISSSWLFSHLELTNSYHTYLIKFEIHEYFKVLASELNKDFKPISIFNWHSIVAHYLRVGLFIE